MDHRLVAWGRAVKARCPPGLPPLWLFTDAGRMDDVVAAVRALPAGLCGVVFRHDGAPGRARLLREVAAVCRARRLALVVAGQGAVPAGAGRHLREGRRPPHTPSLPGSTHPSLPGLTHPSLPGLTRQPRAASGARAARWAPGSSPGVTKPGVTKLGRGAVWTSSAHGRAGLVRARRAGVGLVFLSPAFATASHPGSAGLGPWRWGLLARGAGVAVAALGGVDGGSVRRLPRSVKVAGAIGALLHHSMLPVGHSVSRLPWRSSVHDCEVKKGTAILPSGLADPEPVLH